MIRRLSRIDSTGECADSTGEQDHSTGEQIVPSLDPVPTKVQRLSTGKLAILTEERGDPAGEQIVPTVALKFDEINWHRSKNSLSELVIQVWSSE